MSKPSLYFSAQRGVFLSTLLFVGTLSFAADSGCPTVTFDSLLFEMADRDSLARWPALEYQCKQASSYNRESVAPDKPGWFADSDGISGIREETIDGRKEWVVMEHTGPGCITKMWTPFFYYDFNNRVGPNIKIYLDGSTAPVIDACFIELLTNNDWPDSYGPRPPRKNQFRVPAPLARFTARAGDLYLPIPFAKSCKITMDNKPFYNIINYRAYPKGTKVETFTIEQFNAAKNSMETIGKSLTADELCATENKQGLKAVIPAGKSVSLDLPEGVNAVRSLEFQLDPKQVQAAPSLLRSTLLSMTFDGEETVWCPLGDFFGSANAVNPMHTWTRTVTADGRMTCRWTMPYRKNAKVTLKNLGDKPVSVELGAVVSPWKWDDRSMHFYARWRGDDIQQGNRFLDWNFVEIKGRGVFVGDAWTVLNRTAGWWGEGDEKIYVDGNGSWKFPDHFGTGTEDYYGWAGGVNPNRNDVFSHPYLANVSVGSTEQNNTRGFNICTRIRGLDAIPFTKRFVFDMEASPGTGQRNAWDLLGYSAVTFWYAAPGAVSNRPPTPNDAGRPIMSLERLDRRSDEIRKGK